MAIKYKINHLAKCIKQKLIKCFIQLRLYQFYQMKKYNLTNQVLNNQKPKCTFSSTIASFSQNMSLDQSLVYELYNVQSQFQGKKQAIYAQNETYKNISSSKKERIYQSINKFDCLSNPNTSRKSKNQVSLRIQPSVTREKPKEIINLKRKELLSLKVSFVQEKLNQMKKLFNQRKQQKFQILNLNSSCQYRRSEICALKSNI